MLRSKSCINDYIISSNFLYLKPRYTLRILTTFVWIVLRLLSSFFWCDLQKFKNAEINIFLSNSIPFRALFRNRRYHARIQGSILTYRFRLFQSDSQNHFISYNMVKSTRKWCHAKQSSELSSGADAVNLRYAAELRKRFFVKQHNFLFLVNCTTWVYAKFLLYINGCKW